jgi:hypothetical protein
MSQQVMERADVIPMRADDRSVLFISHRHDDRAVADVVRRFIEARSGGRVTVHQSSSPDAEGPKQGENINDELRRALWSASVVLLIYTTRDQDWSYCMWECGVAQSPTSSTTRTIVFQCAEQFPTVFADQLRVGLRNEKDVEKFVTDLLTDPGYFPKLGRPVTEFAAGTEPVKEAARELHQRIQEVLPVSGGVGDEWPPYPQLTIELTDAQLERIRVAEGPPDARIAAATAVVAEAVVLAGDGQVGRIFSVRGFPRSADMPPIPLRELVSSWEASSPTPQSKWIEGLASQVMAVARDQFPSPRWELMRGADTDDETWYGPMVRYVKRVPRRRSMEIDVVFCKFRLDDERRPKVRVPEIEAEI